MTSRRTAAYSVAMISTRIRTMISIDNEDSRDLDQLSFAEILPGKGTRPQDVQRPFGAPADPTFCSGLRSFGVDTARVARWAVAR